MNYNFKKIQVVPSGADFLDIVLSRTQRKTPTVVHKGYQISRIRSFYMRKVKFTQETFDEKLAQILTDFPKLEDIHPFYADLMNVLYDRDHYKLALGQLNTAKHLIDHVGKEYLKLLKFGDSLYRCKQLKRAALGRMATIMRRQKDSLAYLEQIRQHMARLPSIDPNTRTLLICGYPNVGKSSFMNKVTRAEVDVQPYAFTTKSLFVGHLDYNYLRWQVIDTPGILDHPLEERNTIEMQSITALAHIRACILYFIDCSERCGYSISQQIALFQSIKPLFANKPIMLVANKSDLVRFSELQGEDKAMIQAIVDQGIEIMEASTMTDDGVMQVRNRGCELLLAQRVEYKLKGSKVHDILNKLHVAVPKQRDEKQRPPQIPAAVLDRMRMDSAQRPRTEKDIQAESGGAGVYSVDLKKHYIVADPEWQYDVIPEILDGKNVADFIDPDIDAKLLQLEQEEEEKEARGEYDNADKELDSEEEEIQRMAKEVDDKRKLITLKNRLVKTKTRQAIPIKMLEMKKRRKAVRHAGSEEEQDEHAMDIDSEPLGRRGQRAPARSRSASRGRFAESAMSERSVSRVRDRSMSGFKDVSSQRKSTQLIQTAQRRRNQFGKAGEADRHISAKRPKHLFSGKRKAGTHDYR